MPDDYGYLNARIRGKKSRLLDRQLYMELLSKADLDAFLASLTQTAYREAMEAALARHRGLQALYDGLRRDLTGALLQVRALAEDVPESEPAVLIRVILSRWDRHNLVTLMRAHVPAVGPPSPMDLLVPVGDLDEVDLRELAAQPNLRAMIDLMVTWRLPFAQELSATWAATRGMAPETALEDTLNRAHVQHWLSRLAALPETPSTTLVRRAMGWEVDQRNLLNALRVRQARDRGEVIPEMSSWYLPGGLWSSRSLAVLIEGTEEQANRALRGLVSMPPWSLGRKDRDYHVQMDLSALQLDMEHALQARMAALFHDDPLTIAPVLAYVWAKEGEIRNLRTIGTGIANDMPRDLIEEMLFIPW